MAKTPNKNTKTKNKDPEALPITNSNESQVLGFEYDLGDFISDKTGNKKYIQSSPALVIGVIRMRHPDTFNYATQGSSRPNNVPSDDNSYPAATIDEIFQIQKYCLRATVSQSKANHIGSFSGTFTDPENDLINNVLPGDWILCWMTNNRETAIDVSKRLFTQEAINGFNDGLKFVGKVTTCRKNITVAPSGTKVRSVLITGHSFSEFDYAQYYDPYLVTKIDRDYFIQSVFGDPDNFKRDNSLHYTDLAIPALTTVLLGSGEANIALTDKKLKSPNSNNLIPSVLSALFNLNSPSGGGGQLRYIDLLHMVIGGQTYRKTVKNYPLGFFPEISKIEGKFGLTFRSSYRLRGQFFYQVSPWNNTPIWSILQTYLNPVINEMYTTLRVSNDGQIYPFFILRQQPFNTNAFHSAHPQVQLTPYFSLPRWKIDPGQVISLDIGRSDALRINMVQVISTIGLKNLDELKKQIDRVGRNFLYDKADIKRNGLRARIENVNAEASDVDRDGSSFIWTELKADMLANGHLKYTGSLSVKGIQEPICVGDNLEFDNNIYHIESVTHNIKTDSEGKRSFNTELELSNGMFKNANYTNELWPELKMSSKDIEENIDYQGQIINTEE